MADLDFSKYSNPGIYIAERDQSIFNVTQFFNQITLVLGCSKEGPFNVPLINVSPENFEQKYGIQDFSLERKGSYFHRTVKNMLEEGPVMTVNLRITDPELDKYNWINLSTSSDTLNSNTRTTSINEFYNIADGFWRKSVEQFIDLSINNIPDSNKKPLNIVNQGSKPVSILIYKSTIRGFNITVEDWYGSKDIPLYLHPKDLISDYLVDVYVIAGRWNDYDKLSVDPKWNNYFSKSGFRREKINNFLVEPEIILIKKWTASLIPYFKDKAGRDMYIQSVINNDVDETGVWCAYNTDSIETDFRNGLIDTLGDNLSSDKQPSIDFLSYKRNLTDLYLVEEKLLDQPGNSFGNPNFVLGDREVYNTEGYVYGCKLKKIIVNSTNTLTVKPFDCVDDAYAIINGTLINLNSDISFDLSMPDIITPGNQIAFVLYIDQEGVKFKFGSSLPLSYTLLLPSIDPTKELVLGYYKISQDFNGFETEDYSVQLYGITIDENGYVNPFRLGNEVLPKIIIKDTSFIWQQELYFEKSQNPNYQNYNELRIYHLWYWLANNLKEKHSVFIDINGNKQIINTIEQVNDGLGKTVRISILDKSSNIMNVHGTSGMLCLYMQDLEFIARQERLWLQKIDPFVDGSNGIIGGDSLILQSYLNGNINSGDPFFQNLGDEEQVVFSTDNISNYIILKDGPVANYVGLKIIVYGSEFNDGIFTVLNSTFINGDYALYVQEDIIPESVSKIRLYLAIPKIVNIYFINGKMKAKVEDFDGDIEALYKKIFNKLPESQWKKTLEVVQILENNKILVSGQRYGNTLNLGYYLLAIPTPLTNDDNEILRNWTRIVDIVRYDKDESLIVVETDAPINLKSFENIYETEFLIPIDKWVTTLDFKVLEPFIVREETLPNGTEERLQQILNLVSNNTKMAKSLAIDKMEWRYLVDSFGLGLTTDSKIQLAQLCELKGQALGFINMPSTKQLRNSTSTLYTTNGVLDTKLLLQGGDRRNSSGVRFTLSSEGKSNVMYLTPYVVVSEHGRRFEVPPSSYVCQLYMKKFNNSKVFKPWTIIAGPNYRLTKIAGVEYIYSPEQLNDLHLLRVVPITCFENFIFYLFNENTAEVSNSALGYVHNREALINLELNLKEELNSFQWAFFTDENINLIVAKANEICNNFLKVGAIANYQNFFDDSTELRDAQVAVLNTYVEPVAGMGSIVLRININKTGSIGSE